MQYPRITLWVPDAIDFEEHFSTSKAFHQGVFSKGKMLLVLSLLEPNTKRNELLIYFHERIDGILDINVTDYLLHLQIKGLVDYGSNINMNTDAVTIEAELKPEFWNGRYWNFYVTPTIEKLYYAVIVYLMKVSNNGLSNIHNNEWLNLDVHPIHISSLLFFNN